MKRRLFMAGLAGAAAGPWLTALPTLARQYRAWPNGEHDMTAYLQAKIDRAQLAGGGVVVLVPGIYRISSPLRIYRSGTRLIGKRAVLRPDHGGAIAVTADGIEIRGITIEPLG